MKEKARDLTQKAREREKKTNMDNKAILEFFRKVYKLNLTRKEKIRLSKLFQVRGSNQVNKVMSFKNFKTYLRNNNGKIEKLVLGPSWNRLVFVDINISL